MSKEDATIEGHEIGNECCKACCCGAQECTKEGCDGIMHSLGVIDEIQYGDEWAWVHEYLCDKCGEFQGD
jgi:hypothetical protein